jgi:4-amino-4-deoxy-L-arabinose transferase-like glycosyltransferase
VKRNHVLIALVALHLLLLSLLALFNPHALLIDDAYYSLTIARNMATGQGISYGGFPTNGFQPLYAFVMTPLMAALGDRPELCLRLALLLMVACSAGLLIVIYRLTARLVDERAALVAGALYVANAALVAQVMSGLESALHGLLFWGFVALYLRYRATDSAKALAGLGLLLGLTAYARFDTVFLFFAVGVDLIRQNWRRALRRGFALFAPALALLAPWFIWSWRTFGTIAQSSGEFHRWRGLAQQDLPSSLAGMVKFAAAKLVSLALKLPLEAVGWESASRVLAKHWLGTDRPRTGLLVELLQRRPLLAIALLAAVIVALVLVVRFGRAGLRRVRVLGPLAFLWPALACAAVYYPLYQLNYSMRHFFPYNVGMVIVLATFLSGLGVGAGLKRAPTESQRGAAVLRGKQIAIMLALVLATAWPAAPMWLRNAEGKVPRGEIAAIEQVVEPGARVGYTDCGVFGFYVRGRIIVNLDGILNFEAQREMRNGDIGKYLVRRHVDYVLYLHNFRADFARQWRDYIIPVTEPVSQADWIYRVTGQQ